ncbi:MAG TPA: multicopper oxidase domain-containing protein [Anaeromyxobacteraceae bacterium]|nr:multicopper oxidase domain-containing protein [Anaeromyxobacteraceae bacterium]
MMRSAGWYAPIVAALLAIPGGAARAAPDQVQLDPGTLSRYLDPLPLPAKLDATRAATVSMTEFAQQVLPSNFKAGPYGGKTLVWGYNGSYPGPTLEAKVGVPFQVTYANNLVSPALLAHLPVDQSLHWADPLSCGSACAGQRYTGPVPTVVHLHGGELPSAFDGNPEAWFTPGAAIKGKGFVTTTYVYPNGQEATTLWYHDHALGITRLNVYAGLAGFYLLRDPVHEPANLPSGTYEREIVIQDRMFDTNGQLFYPENGSRYGSSFWIDRFLGDTIVVNGKAWPYLNVEPRRYRFRLLNGSNSRIYTLALQTASGAAGPVLWQIGTDGGLLDKPIKATPLTIAPGERADVVVDFTGAKGASYLLANSNSDRSNGSYSSSNLTSEIIKVNVSLPLNGTDSSLNPSTLPALRASNPMVKLSPTVTSSTPARHMTLEHSNGEFLLNGLRWSDPATEVPRVGATEVWQIDNHTGDIHPIHLHLVQFQVQSGSYSGWGGSGSDATANGWKDTVPIQGWGTVTLVARWAPQDVPAGGVQPGQNLFDFDPTAAKGTTDRFGYPGGPGYVWHCHILEHEDNEMMRPQLVQP